MAVLRQNNWLSQMRVDIPILRAIESAVAADFDVTTGRILAGSQSVVIKGFSLSNLSAGVASTNLQLNTSDGIACNLNASESGSFIWIPSNQPIDTLNPSTNDKIDGSWTPGQTNYIGIDFIRAADTNTSDLVQFLNPDTLEEFPQEIPLAKTIDYRISISTTPFSSQPNLIPIAKVVLDSSSNVTSVVDARPLLFRLGSGGDNPLLNYKYSWPQGRTESSSTISSALFSGGDKSLQSQRDWMQAIMTRLWEVGGGEYWYSATADRNINLIWTGSIFSNGENFEFVASNVHWKGLRFLFDNSTSYFNDIKNQTTDSSGLTNLVDGECLYVDLDRTQYRANQWLANTSYLTGEAVYNLDGITGRVYIALNDGVSAASGGPTGTSSSIADNTVNWKYIANGSTAIIPAKTTLITLGTGLSPGARQIIAWRIGNNIYTKNWRYAVGTTFIPATTISLGVVKLSRAASTPSQPIVISDRGGTLISASGTNNICLTITGDGSGAGVVASGGTTGYGIRGSGGTEKEGVQGNGGAGGNGVVGNGGAGTATYFCGTGGVFVGGTTSSTIIVPPKSGGIGSSSTGGSGGSYTGATPATNGGVGGTGLSVAAGDGGSSTQGTGGDGGRGLVVSGGDGGSGSTDDGLGGIGLVVAGGTGRGGQYSISGTGGNTTDSVSPPGDGCGFIGGTGDGVDSEGGSGGLLRGGDASGSGNDNGGVGVFAVGGNCTGSGGLGSGVIGSGYGATLVLNTNGVGGAFQGSDGCNSLVAYGGSSATTATFDNGDTGTVVAITGPDGSTTNNSLSITNNSSGNNSALYATQANSFPTIKCQNTNTGSALDVGSGHASFSGGNPSATTGFTNTLTPKNVPKAIATISLGATPTLVNGFNIDHVTYADDGLGANEFLEIFYADPLLNTGATVSISWSKGYAAQTIRPFSTTGTSGIVLEAIDAVESRIDFTGLTGTLHVVIFGDQ